MNNCCRFNRRYARSTNICNFDAQTVLPNDAFILGRNFFQNGICHVENTSVVKLKRGAKYKVSLILATNNNLTDTVSVTINGVVQENLVCRAVGGVIGDIIVSDCSELKIINTSLVNITTSVSTAPNISLTIERI